MANEFPAVAIVLGFTAGESSAWVTDCGFAVYLLGSLTPPVDSFASAVTGYANTILNGPASPSVVGLPPALSWPPDDMPTPVAPGIDGRRQRMVERIKSSPAYTPLVIGKLLRTENTGAPFDPAAYVGQIRSVKENGQNQAVIAFGKAGGHIDGVNLYMQRTGDAAPVKIGQFTHTPAIDSTPLKVPGTPEERTYTVIGVIKDVEIGLPSPPVSLLVKLGTGDRERRR